MESSFTLAAQGAVDTLVQVYGEPATLNGVPVSIVFGRQDPIIDFPGFVTQVRSPGLRGEVRQAEYAPRPAKGDAVSCLDGIYAGTYAVADVAEDVERTQWVLDLTG
jgi:hypothetical protein